MRARFLHLACQGVFIGGLRIGGGTIFKVGGTSARQKN